MLNMLTAQHINKSCKHSGSSHWVIKRAYKRKKENKIREQIGKQPIGLICVIDKSQEFKSEDTEER